MLQDRETVAIIAVAVLFLCCSYVGTYLAATAHTAALQTSRTHGRLNGLDTAAAEGQHSHSLPQAGGVAVVRTAAEESAGHFMAADQASEPEGCSLDLPAYHIEWCG